MIRKTVVEVLCEEPVTHKSVQEAMHKYKRENVDYPESLVLSPKQKHELLAVYKPDLQPLVDIETIFGTKILVDPSLNDGEWKLVKEVSKTYDIR